MKKESQSNPSGSIVKPEMRQFSVVINRLAIFCLLISFLAIKTFAQDDQQQKALQVYGFAMMDAGYDFKQINPNWFDALRITKLPKYKNQFAPDGKVFFGVRQTRFGVAGYSPTPMGDLKVVYEFDMFGVGVDEGQTTMRLRHAYGELGRFLAGQTNSPFMDGDVWPNTLEYWGPSGMVFYRNVQLRYAIMKGTNEVFVALERPGASADKGTFSDRSELANVRGVNSAPDVSAHYKRTGTWGHFQVAGILRPIKWKDTITSDGNDISGSLTGWGANFSTALNIFKSTVFRGQFVYGEGIENYMQDAPVDVGAVPTGVPSKPIDGKLLPVTGILAWIDHNWNDKWWTSIGYSSVHIENTKYGSPDAYKNGTYSMLTIGTTPFKNVMAAVEFQYGKRENFSDGFSSDEFKIHFGFKYNFSQTFYINQNKNQD
jgi:outer membrane DcaP-like protein